MARARRNRDARRAGRPAARPAKITRPRFARGTTSGVAAALARTAAAAAEPRRLLDVAPLLWVLLDAAGTILDINDAGCDMLGVDPRRAPGLPFRTFVGSEDRRLFLEHVRRCRAGETLVQTDVQLQARDGGGFLARLYSRRAYHGGRIVFPTIAIDLTELVTLDRARVMAEEKQQRAEHERELARAADAAKDQVIAMVSHELRNPLMPALMAAATLATSPDVPERLRRLGAVIQRNIELEARLIDDLVDISRVARGRLTLRLRPADVHEVIQQAVESCGPEAARRQIGIHLELQAERHVAYADAGRLRQVIWNVLNNAIKFSRRGESVLVRTVNDDRLLRIVIRDFGSGMDRATLQRLFTPFERPAGHTDGRAGLGLGLAISRGIVESHGGRIHASSAGPDMGALFEIELATSADAAEAVGNPSPDWPLSATSDTPPARRVLLVEDDADTAAQVSGWLHEQGFQTTVVRTLNDALVALSEPWDAVVSDIGLPDGSGLHVARRARVSATPPRLVAVSGFGSPADVAASLDAGFDAHLVKPVSPARILSVLSRVPDTT